MEAKIQEVYVCQQARTQDLNDRTYNRNLASKQMMPKYFSRAISNRRTVMPTIDSRKKTTVKKGSFKDYNMKYDFHPGVGGPYSAYSNNIDKESLLFNRFNVLQKCPQVNYIPGSGSDLFNATLPVASNNGQQFKLLQKIDHAKKFNLDKKNLLLSIKEIIENEAR